MSERDVTYFVYDLQAAPSGGSIAWKDTKQNNENVNQMAGDDSLTVRRDGNNNLTKRRRKPQIQ